MTTVDEMEWALDKLREYLIAAGYDDTYILHLWMRTPGEVRELIFNLFQITKSVQGNTVTESEGKTTL